MFVLLVGTAQAAFVADTYLHPLDGDVSQQTLDFIGATPPFDIKGFEWSTPTTLNIYTDWNLGLAGTYNPTYLSVQLGDVFFTTVSGTKFGVALRDHTFETSKNAADTITAGSIYAATNTYTSDWYYGIPSGTVAPMATVHYGDNEIVTGYGDVLGNASIGYAANGTTNPGLYVITVQLDSSYAGTIAGFSFGTTCANDVVVGVPEPATLLFLGLGFVGAAVYGRYRRREGR
jgi:hypothetical protein